MSISVNPVVGFNFTTSKDSTYGTSVSLTANSSATRDANGLDLSASGAYYDAAAPAGLQLTLPITVMLVFRTTVANSITADCHHGLTVGASTLTDGAYSIYGRGTSSPRFYTRNNTTGVTFTSTNATWATGQDHTIFVEYTTAAITYRWASGGAVTTETASTSTRSSPNYSGYSQLVFGTTARGSTHRIKHYAVWNSTLTAQDRTDLVANPLAYEAASVKRRAKVIISGVERTWLRNDTAVASALVTSGQPIVDGSAPSNTTPYDRNRRRRRCAILLWRRFRGPK